MHHLKHKSDKCVLLIKLFFIHILLIMLEEQYDSFISECSYVFNLYFIIQVLTMAGRLLYAKNNVDGKNFQAM